MCMSEVIASLRGSGIEVKETQIRWAIKTGKVAIPRRDGSFRFDFTDENTAELAAHFSSKAEVQHA